MKRSSVVVVAALVSSLFSSGAAFAQKKPKPAPAKRSDSCAEQRKQDPKAVCTLDIEGSDVDGEKVTPNGEQILAHPPARFGSLIRYRETMVDKLVKDADRF